MSDEDLLKDYISNNAVTIQYLFNDTGKIRDINMDFLDFLKQQNKYEEFIALPQDMQDLIRYLGYICLQDKRYDECLDFIKRIL